MRLKFLTSRTSIAVTFAGLALFLALIFYFSFINPLRRVPEAPKPNVEQEEITAGIPARIKIPAINVDAAVESLSLTPKGNTDTPKGPDNVAWFRLGTRPGESGSAVMAGHYGTWKSGKGSVFDNLHKLKKGDKIVIEDDRGAKIIFVVRESRDYDPQADATDVFSSSDDKAHLNLITCEGIWNKDSKSYSKRLVVFTDKE